MQRLAGKYINHTSRVTTIETLRDSLYLISEHQEDNCASNSSGRKSIAKRSLSKFFRFPFP